MPAKFRADLGERVIVNRGLDDCLFVYTMEQWEEVYKKLQKLPSTKKDARNFQRFMLAKASECELDSMGRITIPQNLVSLAGLEKECLVIGVANHIEIWSREKWDKLEEEQAENFEEMAENLSDVFDF